MHGYSRTVRPRVGLRLDRERGNAIRAARVVQGQLMRFSTEAPSRDHGRTRRGLATGHSLGCLIQPRPGTTRTRRYVSPTPARRLAGRFASRCLAAPGLCYLHARLGRWWPRLTGSVPQIPSYDPIRHAGAVSDGANATAQSARREGPLKTHPSLSGMPRVAFSAPVAAANRAAACYPGDYSGRS